MSHVPARGPELLRSTDSVWSGFRPGARPWTYCSAAILILATAAYIPYAILSDEGPRGGSWPGLIYGFVATASILVPMLIPLRNRFPALRFGKPALWMQAHVWFGLLSYPLAIFHAGKLGWHGLLSQVLMGVFTLLLISGIVCLFLQRTLPTVTALQALSGDRRHIARQRRLRMLLDGWLLVHVPLAYLLLVLVVIHSVMAFRFTSPG